MEFMFKEEKILNLDELKALDTSDIVEYETRYVNEDLTFYMWKENRWEEMLIGDQFRSSRIVQSNANTIMDVTADFLKNFK